MTDSGLGVSVCFGVNLRMFAHHPPVLLLEGGDCLSIQYTKLWTGWEASVTVLFPPDAQKPIADSRTVAKATMTSDCVNDSDIS